MTAATQPGWRRSATLLAIAALALLALFYRDAAHMASIWWNASTFNHCLLIIPIIAWLVQQRWPAIQATAPRAWWPGLIVVAGGALAWLLGEAAGVALARHLGLVVMLQGAVVALLGPTVARALLFPLLYALFLVPFGEEFVPALQVLTAKLAMAMLGWVGIPAHIEGVFITTPRGWFEVAEACSGVKFVIAMVALGALAAQQLFARWGRRIGFMALAVVVPIVANGIRAFATIWYGETYGVEHAAGFDHIIFGWVFFALVIAIVLGIGWCFSDREPGAAAASVADTRRSGAPAIPLLVTMIAIAVLPVAWLAVGAAQGPRLAARMDAPVIAGWSPVASRNAAPWQPRFPGADRVRRVTYADGTGRRVDLVLAAFVRQREGHELVGYGVGALDEANGWSWSGDEPAIGAMAVDRYVTADASRSVASLYRIGDRVTADPRRVKLATLAARLLGSDQRAVAILVSSEHGADAIRDFLASAGSPAALADAALQSR